MMQLNREALEDDELEATAGGFLFDIIFHGTSAKTADGSVCPVCGGATGMVESPFGYNGRYLRCEKCGNTITVPIDDIDQAAKL